MAHAHGIGKAGNDGVDILEGTAQFHAQHVVVGIDTEAFGAQRFLHQGSHLGIVAGHHGAGRTVIDDFLGQVGAAQDSYAGQRYFLCQDLAHQFESNGLDALGGSNQDYARMQQRLHLPHHRAEAVTGHRHENQIDVLHHIAELMGGNDTGMQFQPGQIQ